MLTRDHSTIAVVLGATCGLLVSGMLAWLLAQGPVTVFPAAQGAEPRIVTVAATSVGGMDAAAFRPIWLPAGQADTTDPSDAQAKQPAAAQPMARTTPRKELAAAPIVSQVAPSRAEPAREKPAREKPAREKPADEEGGHDWGNWGDWGHRGGGGGGGHR